MNALFFILSLVCLAAWYLGCEFLAEYLARSSHPKQHVMRSAVAIAQIGVPLVLLALAIPLTKLGVLLAFFIVWEFGLNRLGDFLDRVKHERIRRMSSMVFFFRLAGPFLAAVLILKG